MPPLLTFALETAIPLLLKLAADKNVINEEQKLSMEALVATEDFLGKLKTEDIYPSGVNGQFEEREPSASNINREDVTG
jgi:hypothetical protein